jgi:hypothetical protein
MAPLELFRKALPPQKSTDHDGADTRVGVDAYQMVPVTGSRPFNVRMPGGAVRIEVFSTLGAEISIDGSSPAKFQVLNGAAQSERTFTIHARGEGRTTIFALDENRTILDRMIVSVKTERPLTYNLHRLGDSLRDTRRTTEELRSIMGTVEKTYLLQANVRLTRRNESVLRVKKDLGDPIDTTEPGTLAIRPNLRVVLKKRLGELGFLGENVNLISSWRLSSGENSLAGFTPDLGTICICEAKDDPLVEASAYAHEMGHALGLVHPNHNSFELMNGKGQDSFRMNQPDIDGVNPSGTKGLPQQ